MTRRDAAPLWREGMALTSVADTTTGDTNQKPQTAPESVYLAEARRRVLIFDGAMGTQILNLNLSAADYGGERYDGCPEILAVSRPDLIGEIHRAYLAAGADVIETDTFTGTRLKLDDYGLGEETNIKKNRIKKVKIVVSLKKMKGLTK